MERSINPTTLSEEGFDIAPVQLIIRNSLNRLFKDHFTILYERNRISIKFFEVIIKKLQKKWKIMVFENQNMTYFY